MELSNEERLTRDTYNRHGHVWAKNRGDEKYYSKELAEFNRLLPKGRVLDIGSGSGRDARAISSLGYQYVGVDISSTLLEIARKRLPELKFLKQSLYNLSFPYKFDGFWAAAVLVHIPKPRMDEALSSIKNVIKPGAIGFINVKDIENGIEEEIEEYEIQKGTTLKRFYSYWNKNDFETLLKGHGFEVIEYSKRSVADRRLWHCFFVRLK